tara:strand:- start:372 stop:482 length:111 start_codon:yes stop_codon:yes gene_type:complete
MARELKNFLSNLEPVWEDPNEFDWLRKKTENILSKI